MSPRKRRDETTPQDLPVAGPGAETQQVDILGIRFPLWTRDQALGALLQRLRAELGVNGDHRAGFRDFGGEGCAADGGEEEECFHKMEFLVLLI